MKPLVYKPPKWEKNADSTLKSEADYLKRYGDKLRGAARCAERYLHPELDPPMLPHIEDPASCYFPDVQSVPLAVRGSVYAGTGSGML